MKYLHPALLLVFILILGCAENKGTKKLNDGNSQETPMEIPNRMVNRSLLCYDNSTSRWSLNDTLYSGYMVCFYQDSTLREKIGVLNGRKQHRAIWWYPDGHLKQMADYNQGRLHGEKKLWSSDNPHILISHLNYHFGKAHGIQKQWYPSGELYKRLNLNLGKEEGLQQAFRKNGKVYANYEAKNGRIFGLKKTALCYGLEDEEIKYKK